MLPRIIVIVGPTGSGKTDLGIFLAKKFNGEVVNADSRQIYRGMNIGTGKPSFEKKRPPLPRGERVGVRVDGVSHHLFDIASPKKVVTAAEWKQRAVKVIRDIVRRGKLPIVVGGTGLYVWALVDNLDIPQVPPNLKLRRRLEKELAKNGVGILWKRLIKLDPQARDVVQHNNPRRVIRALEVCLATGKPFTAQRIKGRPLFEVLQIEVKLPRRELYRRIDRRVDWQIKHGLIKETKLLLKKYPRTLPAMSGIGYGEIADYLQAPSPHPSPARGEGIHQKTLSLEGRGQGEGDLVRTIQKIKYRTHNYARRQLSWFRRDSRIHWIRNRQTAVKLVRALFRGQDAKFSRP